MATNSKNHATSRNGIMNDLLRFVFTDQYEF